MELIATEYETECNGWIFIISRTTKGWIVLYYDASHVRIPATTKIRTVSGWELVTYQETTTRYFTSSNFAVKDIEAQLNEIGNP